MENEFSQNNLKNRRIERAVDISAELFLKKGIDNVKMTDIADASGIGVATLYRYFGTKTGVTITVMTHLWNNLKEMFSGIFDSEVFRSQKGIKQVRDLMRMFVILYTTHKDFMKLLGEFDLFIIREQVPKEKLEGYEKSIINFYPIFETSCKAGIEDGSIRDNLNFQLFYTTYAHALMELIKKLLQGELLPNDNFSNGEKELELLVDSAVNYIKKI